MRKQLEMILAVATLVVTIVTAFKTLLDAFEQAKRVFKRSELDLVDQ